MAAVHCSLLGPAGGRRPRSRFGLRRAASREGNNQPRPPAYTAVQEKLRLPTCNQRFGSPLVRYFAPLVVNDGQGFWYLGEDYAFCERARQAGFRVMADTSIRLWHVGSYRFGWEDAGRDPERFGDYTFRLSPPVTPGARGEDVPPSQPPELGR